MKTLWDKWFKAAPYITLLCFIGVFLIPTTSLFFWVPFVIGVPAGATMWMTESDQQERLDGCRDHWNDKSNDSDCS